MEYEFIRLGNKTFCVIFPTFIHEIKDKDHSASGELHKTIDRIFYRLRRWLICHDTLPVYKIFNTGLGFIWGINCGFPLRDVALWAVWYLRGCKGEWVEVKKSLDMA